MEEKEPLELIVRYLANRATPDEQEQLFEWVAADPSHQDLFNDYLAAWNKEFATPKRFDAHAALKRVNTLLDQEEGEKRSQQRRTWLRAAAAVAVLAIAGLGAYLINFESEPAWIVSSVPAGKKITVQLHDGTTVKINSESTLKYPERFSAENREVYLTGEAFFEVMPDAKHPFIVHTGGTRTRVLGTSFVIREQPDEVSVAVATGKVEVTANEKKATLLPFQKVTWSSASGELTQEKTSLERELAWSQNTIHFENDSLENAIRVLERWYGITITLQNKNLSKCLISGRFRNEPLTRVLQAIEYSLGVTCQVTNKHVTISGTGCN